MARPLKYTPLLADRICTEIADGASLRSTCDKLRIPRRTVRDWLERLPDFEHKYEIARRRGIERHVDELIELADRLPEGADAATVNAVRLQIDARKWVASKLIPERYSERWMGELTG